MRRTFESRHHSRQVRADGARRCGTLLAALLLAPLAHPQGETAAPAESTREPDVPARIFVTRCTGCHTIGRGNLTGPDLKPATGWAAADLRTAVQKMQDKSGPMTPDEIDGVVALLKDAEIASRLAAEEARIALQFAATLAPASHSEGERLFDGESALENGGLPCIACHRVGGARGGTLGPDLAGVFSRTGETGLRSALEKAQFKVMAPAYRDRPVTAQEAAHLTAFFGWIEKRSEPSGAPPIVEIGVVIAALFFLGTRLVLRDRHQSSRRALARRSS